MPSAAASAIDQPWCDLTGLSEGMPPGRNALAAAVIAQVVPALSRFADRGLPDIIARWPDYDALAGQTVRVDDARAAFDSEVRGLAIAGGLREIGRASCRGRGCQYV